MGHTAHALLPSSPCRRLRPVLAAILALGFLSVLGCAHQATDRPSDLAIPEVTPALIADTEVSRMLVGRWDGEQEASWGYGRNPYRTLIVDRVTAGEGPAWRAQGRWGYTDQCCVRVDIQVERAQSHWLLSFAGPVGDRYTLSTADGKSMQGTMRYDYDTRKTLALTRSAPTARTLPSPRPLASIDALVGDWAGWAVSPAAGKSYQVEMRIEPDGSYSGRRLGAGIISVIDTRYATLTPTRSTAGATITLHDEGGTQVLRLVFTGGTVADLTRAR